MLCDGMGGDVLLMSADAPVASASAPSPGELPIDWGCCAAASPLRRFCGLALRVGQQTLGVVTLAWSSDCPVPPGLRPQHQSSAAVGAATRPRLAPAPAGEAERGALQQLAQVFGLGLFGDAGSVAYGQKVAAMLQLMLQAVTLQSLLDIIMTGVRAALLQRCQLDLSATLAVAHPSLPTAAFIALNDSRQHPLLQPSNSGGGTGSGPRPASGAMATVPNAPGASGGGRTMPIPGAQARPGAPPAGPGGAPGAAAGSGAAAGAAAGQHHPFHQAQAQAHLGAPAGAGPGGAPARSYNSVLNGASRAARSGEVGRQGLHAGSGPFRNAFSMEFNGAAAAGEAEAGGAQSVHAHVASLAHTLLMASMVSGVETDDHVSASGSLNTHRRPHDVKHVLEREREQVQALTARAGGAAGGAASANGRANGIAGGAGTGNAGVGGGSGGAGAGTALAGLLTPAGCVVPNCHQHVQDEALPCRDVVLVQKLARMPVQALVLVLVRPDEAPGAGASRTGPGVGWASGGAGSGGAGGSASSVLGLGSSLPCLALYLTSPDPLARLVLLSAQIEARDLMRLALAVLCRQVTAGPLMEEWGGLVDALAHAGGGGRVSFGSSRLVSLLRPRSCNVLQQQLSGELVPYPALSSMNSRGQSTAAGGMLSGEMSRPLQSTPGATSRGVGPVLVVESGGEQPLQQLDAMVSSIQSTLSAVQLQLEGPGGGGDNQEVRLNDIAAVELMEVIGRGGQGVVFRGTVHGIEAAVKVISHRDDAEATPATPSAPPTPAAVAAAKAGAAGAAAAAAANDGTGSEAAAAAAIAAAAAAAAAANGPAGGGSIDSQMVDEARMRERKRTLLRDALELAVTSTISHPNIVQMYGYFTDCVVVQYAHQSNRLKLLPADSEALQQQGGAGGGAGGRGPVNTVMCMEYCDAGTLKSVAEAGAFRQPGVSARSGPACPALVPLYTSLLEVALALRHLHGRRLVHCDLKPSNVLLKSSMRDPRGWTCKLSDFGCVRVMNEETSDARLGFRQPQPLGTLTHMAPEMFVRGGLLDAAVDVYAFGIIMWELIMVAPLYDGTVPKEKLPVRGGC
ncbi:hypothetical protein GPECTOR_7g968 [Gonium pectorale]|uniref:Protein kinase domain-containing protein n=1 Tax=Gonium pectorale TaxID=33097 RepID=A0A150GUZ8_GONPE|nr:hypothetical protein GPECTOR_7g968 [Gonium pectorale]|eukprot:KXZ53518.1 hypothetical protein GPECTOR_7g968 [Gonium pectorale]